MPLVPFIPAEIDDLGLTPQEFRVMGHVARRAGKDGVCFEAIANMAKKCLLHPDTVRATLKSLVRRGVIFGKNRTGDTTLYAFTPFETKGGVSPTPPKPMEATSPKGMVPYPSEMKGAKGIPIKGSPLKA